VVASAIEHHAVLEATAEVGGRLVGVDRWGRVEPTALAERLDPEVRLVSIMLVNNEVGVVQPLDELAEVVHREAPDAFFHSDAVQAATWLDLPTRAGAADLLSLSAHKLGGPKGVGALIVRSHVPLRAQLVGGGQERGRRSGTSNVAGIAGFGAAAAEVVATRDVTVARLGALRQRLLDGLAARLPGCVPTVIAAGEAAGGRPVEVVPGIVHVCVEGVESEALLFLADQAGVCASAGASCSSGAVQLSHVLAALGVDERRGRGALRLSLGWSSTEADVDAAVEALAAAGARLAARAR
jgi:cysteine desulfurase